MFYSAADHTTASGAVLPTFDELLVGPADDGEDAGVATEANAYVWPTRAWLPPTKLRRSEKTLCGASDTAAR